MKKWKMVLTAAMPLAMALSFPTFAGEWQEDMNGWKYQNDDGSYCRNGWYWLDNVQQGAKAVSKDVYQESKAGQWADRADGTGKWVRYDAQGHMIKGWSADKRYYFDPIYGTMAKGDAVIDGRTYHFDKNTGVLQ